MLSYVARERKGSWHVNRREGAVTTGKTGENVGSESDAQADVIKPSFEPFAHFRKTRSTRVVGLPPSATLGVVSLRRAGRARMSIRADAEGVSLHHDCSRLREIKGQNECR